MSIFGLQTLNQKRRELASTPIVPQIPIQVDTINKKIVVAIVVYNRFANLVRWIQCWNQCEKFDAEFVVIHNFDNSIESEKYKTLCEEGGVGYVGRRNIGYDIGAFQDVCRNRLVSFPIDWDYIFWATDDTIPMSKRFLAPFINAISRSNVGAACLEISKEVGLHIRTSGFMIRREIANKLVFPADPIISKKQCYEFEHLSKNTFIDQIRGLGLIAIMPVPFPNGELWDIGHRARHNRWAQHNSIFGENEVDIKVEEDGDRVTIICPIYNSYPQIISSLICQTHKNWELILIHDGENVSGLQEIVTAANDDRIKYIVYPRRLNNWGHGLRNWSLKMMKSGKMSVDSNYIVITNPDNYYVPTFLEYMMQGFEKDIVATYCDKFVHGYESHQDVQGVNTVHKWGVLDSRLKLGWLDCGGVMVRKSVAMEIGWRSMEIYSDWTYFEDIIKKYGAESFKRVNGCLFVHN